MNRIITIERGDLILTQEEPPSAGLTLNLELAKQTRPAMIIKERPDMGQQTTFSKYTVILPWSTVLYHGRILTMTAERNNDR